MIRNADHDRPEWPFMISGMRSRGADDRRHTVRQETEAAYATLDPAQFLNDIHRVQVRLFLTSLCTAERARHRARKRK
jgi:hypothetical protein